MSALVTRLAAAFALDPEERWLAGRVSGALYAVGGLTVWTFLLLPGVGHSQPGWIIATAVGATLWGLCSFLLIDWGRHGAWLIHVSVASGFAVIATVVASSGAGRSPGWIYLFFIVVFACYFFRWGTAVAYVAGALLTLALPLIYNPQAIHTAYLSQLIVGGLTQIALGATIASGKQLMRTVRGRAEMLASEQGALRRVATAVIEGEPPETVFALVAREAAALLRGGAAGILRFDPDQQATVVGSWSDHEGGRYEPGTAIPIRPGQ